MREKQEKLEKQGVKSGQNQLYQNVSSDDESSASYDQSAYEKKANLVLIQAIFLQRSEDGANHERLDQVLNEQKQFLIACCCYLIESKAILTLPGSNIFFQQLVTYINRVIITKQASFVNTILINELG